jgi:hypothetical protein
MTADCAAAFTSTIAFTVAAWVSAAWAVPEKSVSTESRPTMTLSQKAFFCE